MGASGAAMHLQPFLRECARVVGSEDGGWADKVVVRRSWSNVSFSRFDEIIEFLLNASDQ